MNHTVHLTIHFFRRDVLHVSKWKGTILIVIIIVSIPPLSLRDLKIAHFSFATTAHHELIFLVIIILLSVVILVIVFLLEYHALRLSLAAKHSRLHVSFLLISLSLHLFQEVFSVRLLKDSARLFLIFVRLEENPTENFRSNSLMEAIWNKFRELVKLFLLILGVLRFLNESNDFFLDLLGKI